MHDKTKKQQGHHHPEHAHNSHGHSHHGSTTKPGSGAGGGATAGGPAAASGGADKGAAMVEVLSCVLRRLVAANDQKLRGHEVPMTKFHALRTPGISIRDYLQRVLKFSACSPECFVLALVYIDRLIQSNAFVLSSLNVHRVIITSVMLAAKFFDDMYFNNQYYAQVGGLPTYELNALELEFLFSINFTLLVTPTDFHKYEAELKKHVLTAEACGCSSIVPVVEEVFVDFLAEAQRAAAATNSTAAAAVPATSARPTAAGAGATSSSSNSNSGGAGGGAGASSVHTHAQQAAVPPRVPHVAAAGAATTAAAPHVPAAPPLPTDYAAAAAAASEDMAMAPAALVAAPHGMHTGTVEAAHAQHVTHHYGAAPSHGTTSASHTPVYA